MTMTTSKKHFFDGNTLLADDEKQGRQKGENVVWYAHRVAFTRSRHDVANGRAWAGREEVI
jgi:hypothetical protein